MRFQLLTGWWLLLPIVLLALGAVIWQVLLVRKGSKDVLISWVRRASLLLLLTLMILGPSVPGATSSPGVANLDVLFVVDTTASMGAQDYAGGKMRLEGVKRDLLELSSKLQGAHLALTTFDSKVDPVLPFNSDMATFEAAVRGINREIYVNSNGSAIDKPIQLITQQLKNSKIAHPERSRMLFYLGDGEQTADAPVKSFAPIAAYVNGGAVLGYGTSKGSKIPRYNGLDDQTTKSTSKVSYVTTPDSQTKGLVPAISKIDEAALKKIAGETKLPYQNRNKVEPIANLVKSSDAEQLIDRGKKVTHYLNLYWLLAVPFVFLLFWEWRAILVLFMELRQPNGGTHVK
ncbi:VWA domain-containing protein [soil metagenome]